MEVVSRCVLPATAVIWMPRPNAWALTIACKATFLLAEGSCPLAEEQDEVFAADRAWEDAPRSSLARASDLLPFKAHPEILLVGSAVAPGGRPASRVVARLAVAEIDKSIEAHGDRWFTLDGALSDAKRFARMPLRWERAAGGPDTSNPVGIAMGSEASLDAWGRVPLPNLQPPGAFVADRRDVVAPACFAPVAPSWPQRRTRLHRHAGRFDPARWNEAPLPPDFEPAFFNAAPPDQWLRELTGRERIVLEGMHPSLGRLDTHLAEVHPIAVANLGAGVKHEVPLRCDTMWIDTDRGAISLTFRGQISLLSPDQPGRIEVHLRGHADTAPRAELPSWVRGASDPSATMPTAGADPPAPASLPFELDPADVAIDDEGSDADAPATLRRIPRDAAPLTSPRPIHPAEPSPLPFASPDAPAPAPAPERGSLTTALPFRPVEGAQMGVSALGRSMRLLSERPVAWATPHAGADPLTRVDPWAATPLPAARYGAEGHEAAPWRPAASEWSIEDTSPTDLEQTTSASGDDPRLPAPNPSSIARTGTAPLAPLPPTLAREWGLRAPPPAFVPPPVFVPPPTGEGPIAPPALLGAIAQADTQISLDRAPESARSAPLPTPASAPPPAEISLPLDDFPPEKCGRVAGALAMQGADRSRELASHGLSEEVWEKLHAQILARIEAELGRSRNETLRQYDAGYVASLEAARGPITVGDYARIVVATEAGTIDRVRADLLLPAESTMRVRRVWIARCAKDAKLAKAVRTEVERERDRSEI